MEKFLLKKQNGHEIPCIADFPEDLQKLVIVIHGYDSSKESENAANLMRILPAKSFGVIAYDQPNHGSEQAAAEELSVEACLNSLACVEEYLADRFEWDDEHPFPEICYFGSSFGAYILGIYLTTRKHRGNKAFMRCAAVNFPELVAERILEETTGSPQLSDAENLPDLFELFDRAKPEGVRMAFAHGECDSTVPVSAALDFAKRFGYPITVFPGEEHPICTDPSSPARVAEMATELFR